MIRRTLYNYSIALGLCFMLIVAGTQSSYAQEDTKSTFDLGKQKAQKKPMPGEGSLVGTVVIMGGKKKIPLAFIEVPGVRSIQTDVKGRFNLVLAEGTYKIKISCSGYEELLIESIAIVKGVDQFIKIELALIEKGDFK